MIIRHVILRRVSAPRPAEAKTLPMGCDLQRVSAEECAEIHVWEMTAKSMYATWGEWGACCYIGFWEREPAVRIWVATQSPMLQQLVPWVRETRDSAYVFDVETVPAFRGRGLFRSCLLTLMAELAEQRGVRTFYCRVVPNNVGSIKAFASAGFHRDAVLAEVLVFGKRLWWWREALAESST